jgi:hypothetical protein
MYWPFVGLGSTLQQFMVAYRDVFCRAEGFEHVSRYINGLLLSAKTTLQGIYAQIVWPEGKQAAILILTFKLPKLLEFGRRHRLFKFSYCDFYQKTKPNQGKISIMRIAEFIPPLLNLPSRVSYCFAALQVPWNPSATTWGKAKRQIGSFPKPRSSNIQTSLVWLWASYTTLKIHPRSGC